MRESRSKSNVPSPIDGIEAPVLSLKLVGTDILRNWMEWMEWMDEEESQVQKTKGSRAHLNKCTVCSTSLCCRYLVISGWWGIKPGRVQPHAVVQLGTEERTLQPRQRKASGRCQPKRSARVEFSRNLPGGSGGVTSNHSCPEVLYLFIRSIFRGIIGGVVD